MLTRPTRLVVGVAGASGSIYAVRLLEALRPVAGVETHLVVSGAGKRTLALETNLSLANLQALADHCYQQSDIGAAIASGSFRADGMVVIPCSMKTVSGIASSYSDNLLLRAADVTLKERRRLVLVVRETPLHLGHLRLLTQVTEMGAVVQPPVPAFYTRPTSIDDIVDHTVARVLDLLSIELEEDLAPRWEPAPIGARTAPDSDAKRYAVDGAAVASLVAASR
ncbi:MAG: UbiX family flavin prenyltransferase [Chloroflexi bacterium]|nr:UbiX family flavin prenyltransferase [Chloroflexota bacterium]MBV9601952.1 UbiX family flavin prenyltransferase [Chloroflexota bacterium]